MQAQRDRPTSSKAVKAGRNQGWILLMVCALGVSGAAAGQGTWVSVREFRARGDARIVDDGKMTEGSRILWSNSASFVLADVGRSVYIWGAGPQGGPLT